MNRLLVAGAVAVALTIAPLATSPVLGQQAAKTWTAPKTPWGDPDIQGWFSNLSEHGTPLEKPAQFAGRNREDIKGEELTAIKQAAQNRTIESFAGPLHAPEDWWQKDLNMVKGSQAWLVIDPPDGKVPALTPGATARKAAAAEARRANPRGPSDSWEDRSLYDRCITRGLPGSMMPAIYGNSYQILQTPDTVAIRYEMIHETRLIPLDGRPHASSKIRTYMGDARGHWEGDTLVVETTNFRDEASYRNSNASTLKLVEKFQRVGPSTVKWSVTVDDPKTWGGPWTFATPLSIECTPTA